MSIAATAMRVVKTLAIDVPGLGARIKEARERDPRPLAQICRELKMSPVNWYRIEKEEQTLPIETLRRIEEVLGTNFDVHFDGGDGDGES